MLTVIAGLPCSGKTTLAGTFPRYVSFDYWVEKRYGLPFKAAMRAYAHSYETGRREYLETVCQACAEGDLALDDMFILRADRLEAMNYFRSRGVGPLHLIYFETPLEELLRRNALRERPHRPELIRRLSMIAERPQADEGWDHAIIRVWKPDDAPQR